ncbi:non-ribosomal peptide synthetase [Dactylosporangium sp. NPDC050588]|uniref:non-ribosomal peptide synthetase n=1 Tax=Dactylosporangium sp. NPDC050588 TaxID=3157211 RepID=UPI0033E5A23B
MIGPTHTNGQIGRLFAEDAASSFTIEGRGHRLQRADLARAIGEVAEQLEFPASSRTVLVVAPRCRTSTTVMLLALWANGMVPLLVDRASPTARVDAVRRLADPSTVVTFEGETGTNHEILDDHWTSEYRAAAVDTFDGCPDPAYVSMTSGSTGDPLLALCRWRGLDLVAREWARVAELGPASRVLQFASPAYDAFYTEVVPAIVAGSTLVCPDDDSWAVPSRLATALRARRITHFTAPPSVLSRVLATPVPPRLEFLGSAGEKLETTLARTARRHCSRLVNAYGPAEATVCATVHVVDGSEDEVPIGRPLEGVDVRIKDGEITIAGTTVAWGYLGQPAAGTRFEAETPTSPAVFRPGDLGELRDGLIYFRGRRDRQVKIRGHRLDPSAIEWHLRRIAGVTDCAVFVHGGDLACLMVSDRPLSTVSQESRTILPAAEWPARWARVDAIPYLRSDKLDVARAQVLLDRFETRDAQSAGTADGPRWLAELWERHASFTGDDADFFLSGGDSLSAMELLDAVYESCGVDVDVADFLAEPTFGHLRQLVSRGAGPGLSPVPRPQAVVDDESVELPGLRERQQF